ncbi:MAG: ACT domain-containing protein [Clostridia bacterium]|nr:ACT domain-containing protein [Clostridia bacterium]MBQ8381782.1 ACT domain-containing protein [Clostridia bacterium]
MKAVITVAGKDGVGIVAKVSTECAKYGINIIDISQSVLQDYFAMIMIADIDGLSVGFTEFADRMKALGKAENLEIQAMHEDIFNSMHKI